MELQSKKSFSQNLYVFTLLILILSRPGCVKDEPIPEALPLLTNLSDGDAFERGSAVSIHIDIEEDQSGIITEVRIYIDKREVSVASDFPSYYEWDSKSEEQGNHIVRLASTDTKGNSYEDVFNIRLYDMNRQPCPGGSGAVDTRYDTSTKYYFVYNNDTRFHDYITYARSVRCVKNE